MKRLLRGAVLFGVGTFVGHTLSTWLWYGNVRASELPRQAVGYVAVAFVMSLFGYPSAKEREPRRGFWQRLKEWGKAPS